MNAIDASYDPLFEKRSALPWWPWVGAAFAESPVKTMLLGESVYAWSSPSGEFERRYALRTGTRETHNNHAMQFTRGSKYVRNIERAIFNTRTPGDEQKQKLWTSVVYHNLVLDALPSLRDRPTEAQYLAGWVELLALCELLGIEQCLVYGLESKKLRALQLAAKQRNLDFRKIKVETMVGRNQARFVTLGSGAQSIKLLFVRHPSAFFSWKAWGPVLRDKLSLGFLV
jgi:hypothetical protein